MTQGIFNKIEKISEVFESWMRLEGVRETSDNELVNSRINEAQKAIESVMFTLAQDLIYLYREGKKISP